MRTLETIATTIRTGRAHPTDVMNALVETENAGGQAALLELEYRLARLARAMSERGDEGQPVVRAWLEAARAYLESHYAAEPTPVRPPRLHDLVLHSLNGPRQSGFPIRSGSAFPRVR